MRLARPAWFAALALLGAAGLAQEEAEGPDAARGLREARRLCAEGDFDEALELARGLDQGAAGTTVGLEVAGVLAYLEHAVTLDAAEREELAGSYALDDVITEHFRRDEIDRVLAVLERQLELRHRLCGDLHPERVEDLGLASSYAGQLGRLEEAEALAELALATARRLWDGDHPQLAAALTALGAVRTKTGRHAEAEPLLLEARSVLRRLDRATPSANAATRTALYELFALYSLSGRLGPAREVLTELVDFSAETFGEESFYYLNALNNLTYLLIEEGDHTGAERVGTRTLADAERSLGPRHPVTLLALDLLAWVYDGQGDAVRSEEVRRRKLERTDESHHAYAVTLGSLARNLQHQGRHAEAEELARRALELLHRDRAPDHPDSFHVRAVLAASLLALERLPEAEEVLRETVELFGTSEDPLRVSASLFDLGGALVRRGEHEEARGVLERALSIEREVRPGHVKVAEMLFALAEARALAGDDAAAAALAEESAAVYEEARAVAGSGTARAAFTRSPYPLLALLLLRLDDSRGAWRALGRLHGRVLHDLLLASDRGYLTAEEAGREARLLREATDLESAWRSLRARAGGGGEGGEGALAPRAEEARLAWLDARAALSEWRAECARRHPVESGEAFPLERVQAVLGADEAMVGWLDVPRPGGTLEVRAWIVRSEGDVRWLALPRAGAGVEPASFRRLLAETSRSAFGAPDPAPAAELGRALWEARVAPLEEALADARALVVVPSARMVGVPVDALVDDEGRTLDERFTISYAPSATLAAWLRERAAAARPPGEHRALVLGDPPYRAEHLAAMRREDEGEATRPSSRGGPLDVPFEPERLPRLPRSREEAESVAALFPAAELLVGPAASEQALLDLDRRAALASFDMLHFATHARADRWRPERSELVLSQVGLHDAFEATLAGEAVVDGRLTAAEILGWRLDAELVTLSTCESAAGLEIPGEGAVGLAYAFLQAGARTVVASFWQVDDEATSLLMRRFYENLLGARPDAEPLSKAEALREAKTWLREWRDERGRTPFAHPCYWSSFQLQGASL